MQHNTSALYSGNRHLDLPDIYYPRIFPLLYHELLPDIKIMIKYGGAIILPYRANMERAGINFLYYLLGKMLKIGIGCQMDIFARNVVLNLPGPARTFWFIHNAPAYNNLIFLLSNWLKPGRITILTCPFPFNHAYHLPFPYQVHQVFVEINQNKEKKWHAKVEQLIHKHLEEISKDHDLKNLVQLVAVFEKWSVPVPVIVPEIHFGWPETKLHSLLRKAEKKRIFYLLTSPDNKSGHILTRGPLWAEKYLQDTRDNFGVACNVLSGLDFNNPILRKFFLNIVQAWVAHSGSREKIYKKDIRQVFASIVTTHQDIIVQTTFSELLIWIQLCSAFGLYDLGFAILDAALRTQYHPHLVHQKAHLLLKRSQEEFAINTIKATRQALQKARLEFPDNVHILHSTGMFEKLTGNWKNALKYYDQALAIQPDNHYILMSKIDLLLDQGQFGKAEALVNQALQAGTTSPHLLHILGRIYFYKGQWENAEKTWLDVYNNTGNVYAIQSLAHMQRMRSRWQKSMRYIVQAIKMDSENIPVLLECCKLLEDFYDYASSLPDTNQIDIIKTIKNQYEQLQKNLQLQNLKSLHTILESAFAICQLAATIHPEHFYVQIQMIILEIKRANFKQAEIELKRAEKNRPQSPYLYFAWGKLFFEQKQFTRARHYFQLVRQLHKRNIRIYLRLAEVMFCLNEEREANLAIQIFCNKLQENRENISVAEYITLLLDYKLVVSRYRCHAPINISDVYKAIKQLDKNHPAVL